MSENKKVKVTTLIITYNQEKYIEQAIESAIMQEGDFEHEILVLDDASTDNTHNILLEYCKKYPNLIKDCSSAQNCGISENYKKGIKQATGKYIAILEGDDFWTDKYNLQKKIAFLEKNTDCSMVFSRLNTLNEIEGLEIKAEFQKSFNSKLKPMDWLSETINPVINLSCAMFVADYVKQLPEIIYRYRVSEIPMLFYLSKDHFIGYLNEDLTMYRVCASGVWNGASCIKQIKQAIIVRENAYKVCEKRYRRYLKKEIRRLKKELKHSETHTVINILGIKLKFNKSKSPFRHVFSVREEENHKILTILGIKIKKKQMATKQELFLLRQENKQLRKALDDTKKLMKQEIEAVKSQLPTQVEINRFDDGFNPFWLGVVDSSMLPKFSFVMPTYNRKFCIKNAINSLLNQTYQNFELVIVDDGSTDNTEEYVVENYKQYLDSGKIKYIKTENNGVCKARNIGLAHCSNEWIAYLDSDNIITTNFLETFATNIIKNPDTLTFYGKILNTQKRIIGRAFDFNSLTKGNFIDLGIFVHNRSLYEKLGGFDENLKRLVDWDLIIRYTRLATPVFVDKILLLYNNEQNYERITNKENYREAFDAIQEKIRKEEMLAKN